MNDRCEDWDDSQWRSCRNKAYKHINASYGYSGRTVCRKHFEEHVRLTLIQTWGAAWEDVVQGLREMIGCD